MNGGTKLIVLLFGYFKVKKGFLILKISILIFNITKYTIMF